MTPFNTLIFACIGKEKPSHKGYLTHANGEGGIIQNDGH